MKQIQYQIKVDVPTPQEILEVVGKWGTRYPSFIFDRERIQYLYPSFFSNIEPIVEDITIDMWLGKKPDILFRRKENQYLYGVFEFNPNPVVEEVPDIPQLVQENPVLRRQDNQFFGQFVQNTSPIPETGKIFSQQDIVVYFTEKFQYPGQVFPVQFGDEDITIDKWLGEYVDVLFDKARKQYIYPFIGIQNVSPIPEQAPELSWKGQYQDIIPRHTEFKYTMPDFSMHTEPITDVTITPRRLLMGVGT